uniref:Biopolymer transporter ExbD n=1 Tax=Schlesneria paludicola TaxID=360056 RepID=A0A7C4LN08_9PLAN
MKVAAATRRYGLEFSITPLIDVVFLLNIFFLVATYFVRHEQVDPVELPAATQGREDAEAAARIVVTITSEGLLTIASQPMTIEDVAARLQAAQVEHSETVELRLRCDRRAVYRDLEPLLLTAAKTGVRRVRFSVLSE